MRTSIQESIIIMDGWTPKVDGRKCDDTGKKNAPDPMQGKISMERRKRACGMKDERRREGESMRRTARYNYPLRISISRIPALSSRQPCYDAAGGVKRGGVEGRGRTRTSTS